MGEHPIMTVDEIIAQRDALEADLRACEADRAGHIERFQAEVHTLEAERDQLKDAVRNLGDMGPLREVRAERDRLRALVERAKDLIPVRERSVVYLSWITDAREALAQPEERQ